MMAFWRKVDPEEAREVLGLLGRLFGIFALIDSTTDRTRLAIDQHGMHTNEFEEARLAAKEVVGEFQIQVADYGFWPALEEDRGAGLLLELQAKVNESLRHLLLLLRLQGRVHVRLGTDFDTQTTYVEELVTLNETSKANRDSERIIDELWTVCAKLARHYKISRRDIRTAQRKAAL